MNDCDCGAQAVGEFLDTGLSWMVTTFLVLLAVFLYFIPSIIGRNRRAIAPIFIIIFSSAGLSLAGSWPCAGQQSRMSPDADVSANITAVRLQFTFRKPLSRR